MRMSEMCETIADAWNGFGVDGRIDWTPKQVWDSDPNGELFWIPGEYQKAMVVIHMLKEGIDF